MHLTYIKSKTKIKNDGRRTCRLLYSPCLWLENERASRSAVPVDNKFARPANRPALSRTLQAEMWPVVVVEKDYERVALVLVLNTCYYCGPRQSFLLLVNNKIKTKLFVHISLKKKKHHNSFMFY